MHPILLGRARSGVSDVLHAVYNATLDGENLAPVMQNTSNSVIVGV